MGMRGLEDENRPPTWAEREFIRSGAGSGGDPIVDLTGIPPAFWEALVQATDYLLMSLTGSRDYAQSWREGWHKWEREFLWAMGWGPFRHSPWEAYVEIVRNGSVALDSHWDDMGDPYSLPVEAGVRIAAVEHLLDVRNGSEEFNQAVNERARFLGVGLRLEGHRFIVETSEHLYQEVVVPTFVLLADSRFRAADGLYRKAAERIRAGDFSGAVTAASSAVEDMFRGLGYTGQTLGDLANDARSAGDIPAVMREFIIKLVSLRDESDAHTSGTDDLDMAMFAFHITGSILNYLGRTLV